jgi:hypothetical protein
VPRARRELGEESTAEALSASAVVAPASRQELRWQRLWKADPRFQATPVTADLAADLIIRLGSESEDGVKPEAVVEELRPVDHPLHMFLTWEDDEAARKYRIEQARELIHAVHVVDVVVRDGREIEVGSRPVFVSFRPAGKPERAYFSVDAVVRKPERTRDMLRQALSELEGFRRRYEGLVQLSGVFRELEKLKARSTSGKP